MKQIKLIIVLSLLSQFLFSQTDKNITYRNSIDFFENYQNNISGFNHANFQYSENKKKSVPLAVGLSLLIPGMGELYVGNYNKIGRYLTGAEATLWLTYASLTYYSNWIIDDARKFASINAKVNISGKDEKFFVNIGNYSDIYQYNERKLQERKEEQLYDPNSDYFWQWNSETNRLKYRSLRIKGDDFLNSTQFVLGAILANHIISAVIAGNLAIKYNETNNQTLQINTDVKGTVDFPIFVLTISSTF